jgi:hypothetical protein
VLSLRVSRDKRGYDYIYLLLDARRRGRVENRLLYCGRWPAPCRVGLRPFDSETRARLEQAHPDVAFDWSALLKTLHAALGVSRPSLSTPAPPQSRARRPTGAGAGAWAAYARGGRPGGSQPRRPGMPPPSRRDVEQPVEIEPIEPGETMEETLEEAIEEPIELVVSSESAERDYIPGEVVLVSAEIEERESTYTAPELEPVCEADRQFAAGLDLELMTEEIVHIPVAAATAPETPALPTGGQLFAEASGPAVFHVDPDAPDPGSAPGGGPAAEVAGDAMGRPHRRRRGRGGRGRGKRRDLRQGSE